MPVNPVVSIRTAWNKERHALIILKMLFDQNISKPIKRSICSILCAYLDSCSPMIPGDTRNEYFAELISKRFYAPYKRSKQVNNCWYQRDVISLFKLIMDVTRHHVSAECYDNSWIFRINHVIIQQVDCTIYQLSCTGLRYFDIVFIHTTNLCRINRFTPMPVRAQ